MRLKWTVYSFLISLHGICLLVCADAQFRLPCQMDVTLLCFDCSEVLLEVGDKHWCRFITVFCICSFQLFPPRMDCTISSSGHSSDVGVSASSLDNCSIASTVVHNASHSSSVPGNLFSQCCYLLAILHA